ncbi:hypothetical protein [Aquamicrobium soli]|jgi:hypothetical protein|uniref:Lipoprotein n=1 Tax=Aquamicrobium soli TaxID=1811518 RepID=A0ABV7KCP7_9HYPH
MVSKIVQSEGVRKATRRPRLAIVCVLAAVALGGCTRANDVLEPSAIKPADPAATTSIQPAGPTTGSTQATGSPSDRAASAAALARTRLQIAPIVGATVEAATPLTERLAMRARERGIKLTGSAADQAPTQTPTLMIKGYFSALTEGADTTVIYVWDIYDPAGNRLHRINGQQKAASVKGGDGWSAVAPETMQAVADTTMDQLAAWLGTRTG